MADMANVEELLRKYPSLFDSLNRAGIERENISVDALQDEDIEDINLKESRTLNVVSYAFFNIGEKAKAYELNGRVLHQYPTNVIALSNKAWFLYKDGKCTEAEQVCQKLEEAGNVERLVARGEIAFAYSRFGLKTYDMAVKEYEELLKEIKQSKLPAKYFCMWSFGLNLLLHRKRKDLKTFTESDTTSVQKRLKLLRDVTKVHPADETVRIYQAKCYANICRIRYDQICMMYSGKEKNKQLREEPLQAIEEAYKLGYDDVYTLDLIGKYMRYYPEKVQTSISCLKRSIELRETSKGFHRLALAQKRDLESDEFKKLPKRRPEPNDRIVNVMKCPRKPNVSLDKYKKHPQMIQIMKNLSKAIELDPKNMDAHYDFGLTYRQISEQDNALKQFEHIRKFREGPRTLQQIANAYEQSGFCILDMKFSGKIPPDKMMEFENEMQSFFKKSVEMSCSLVRMVPSLESLWTITPTLGQLMGYNARTSREVKELLFLFERLRSQSNLDIFQKLASIYDQLETNDRRVRDLLKQLISTEKYDDAIVVMELITCLPNGFDVLGGDMYTDVYIKSGLKAYKCGEALLGRLRIVNALEFRRNKLRMRNEKRSIEILDEDIANLQGTEVILIYQNDVIKPAADTLLRVFLEVGVKIKAFAPSQEVICDTGNSAMRNYIALIGGIEENIDDQISLEGAMENLTINNFDTNVDLIMNDLSERDDGNLLVVKLQEVTNVPEQLHDFTCIVFESERERRLDCLDEDDLKFVESALKHMTDA